MIVYRNGKDVTIEVVERMQKELEKKYGPIKTFTYKNGKLVEKGNESNTKQ